MQVLHLTDLHFQHEQPFQKRLFKALLEDVGQKVAESLSPDIIVFSGDLVQNPDDPDVFKYFAELFFFPLLSAARLTSKEVVFCPGNHDVSFRAVDDWKDERANLQKHVASFDSLDAYLKTGPAKAYVRAISAGFYDFLNSIDQSWDDQPLNHVYKFPSRKFSFVSISTAFACGREGSVYDRGKLALPIEHTLRAFQSVPEDYRRFSLMHHAF
jgi:3',5'-cyclic AMP phosphodiesterase CpdA